jgi:hypothetical protein
MVEISRNCTDHKTIADFRKDNGGSHSLGSSDCSSRDDADVSIRHLCIAKVDALHCLMSDARRAAGQQCSGRIFYGC